MRLLTTLTWLTGWTTLTLNAQPNAEYFHRHECSVIRILQWEDTNLDSSAVIKGVILPLDYSSTISIIDPSRYRAWRQRLILKMIFRYFLPIFGVLVDGEADELPHDYTDLNFTSVVLSKTIIVSSGLDCLHTAQLT